MPGALPIRLRPTPRQVAARSIRIGLVTTAVLLVPLGALALVGRLEWIELLVPPAGFVAASALSALWIRRDGVDLDESGVHPVLAGPNRREYAPWHLITEIRAERRGSTTVPVIYLLSGKVWRLRVPYLGVGLGADPEFDEKLSTLRNMWETYHSWQRSP